MGMLQSAHRKGSEISFVEDCQDCRDDRELIICSEMRANFHSLPGPPCRVNMDVDVLLKEEGTRFQLEFEGCVLTDEMRRFMSLLLHCGRKRRSFPTSDAFAIVSFLDFSGMQGFGPKPFYSSRVKVIFYTVRLFGVDRETKNKVENQQWTIHCNPNLPRPSRRREATDVPVAAKQGFVHPSYVLLPLRSWTDGWKRAHLELEHLPIFISDGNNPLILVNQYQPFSFRPRR